MTDPQPIAPDLSARVLEIFERHAPGAAALGLSLESSLTDDLGLPSIAVVAVLFDLQDAFSIDLMGIDVRLGDLQRVRDVAELVASQTAGD